MVSDLISIWLGEIAEDALTFHDYANRGWRKEVDDSYDPDLGWDNDAEHEVELGFVSVARAIFVKLARSPRRCYSLPLRPVERRAGATAAMESLFGDIAGHPLGGPNDWGIEFDAKTYLPGDIDKFLFDAASNVLVAHFIEHRLASLFQHAARICPSLPSGEQVVTTHALWLASALRGAPEPSNV